MSTLAYVALHDRMADAIDAELTAAIEGLGTDTKSVRDAVDTLVGHQRMKYPLSVLPLLVHGAETGAPEPALPLTAVHLLWWTSACYLDDLADARGAGAPEGSAANEALLASVIGGQSLVFRLLGAQPVSDEVRLALTAEVADGWIGAVDGQLKDLRGGAENATRASVRAVYSAKSGAPFGMITAMAALLADREGHGDSGGLGGSGGAWGTGGAEGSGGARGAGGSGRKGERVARWRAFGDVFGILWQLFNDQEDILSGRDEDLRNGTVTYLLACALDEADPAGRRRLLDLGTAARNSEEARRDLKDALLAPTVLGRFRKDLDELRDEAHRLLREADGHPEYTDALHELVDQAAGLHLRPSV